MNEVSRSIGHHRAFLLIVGIGTVAVAGALFAAWAGLSVGSPLLGLGLVALFIAVLRLQVLRRFWPAMVEQGYVSPLFRASSERGSILADLFWLAGALVLAIWMLDQWIDASPLRLLLPGTLVGIAVAPLIDRIVPKA